MAIFTGTAANDTLAGTNDDDTLNGLTGADKMAGGAGNDVIEGGYAADALNGGAGNDLFRYTVDLPAEVEMLGVDTITGFEVGKDKIDILDLFEDFDIGADPVGNGYLKLTVDNGNTMLQFDKNGGGDGLITLATVQGVTNLTLSDLIYESDVGAS